MLVAMTASDVAMGVIVVPPDANVFALIERDERETQRPGPSFVPFAPS